MLKTKKNEKFLHDPLFFGLVEVQIDYINWEQSYICGCLNIFGLTETDPSITTFFNGEIIGNSFPFLTRKWDASFEVDEKHWRFVFENFFVDFKNNNSVNSKTLKNINIISMMMISTFRNWKIHQLFI